jgi:hypothetical protein
MLFTSLALQAVFCIAADIQTASTNVAIGNTENEVRELMGNPKGTMAQGDSAVWFYGSSDVTFKNGKVIGVKGVPVRQPAPVVRTVSAPPSQVRSQPVKPAASPAARESVAATADSKPNTEQQEEPTIPAARGLKSMWTDPAGLSRSTISCTFTTPSLSGAALEAQKQKGMFPFRITASIGISPPPGTTDKDKWASVRTGPCLVRLFNESGVEIVTATVQADKICPS